MLRALGFVPLLLIAAVASHAESAARFDAERGWRGAHFGASVSAFSGLELVGSDERAGTRTYRRPSAEVSVGAAQVDFVTYGFHRGRLYAVGMGVSGEANARAIREEIQKAYGPGRKLRDDSDRLTWTRPASMVHYTVDPDGRGGLLLITSRRVLLPAAAGDAVPARAAPAQ